MRAFLQAEFRVRLRRPGRHETKRANRINRLIGIRPINKLVKVHAFPGIVRSHAWIPDNRSCIARDPTKVASRQLLWSQEFPLLSIMFQLTGPNRPLERSRAIPDATYVLFLKTTIPGKILHPSPKASGWYRPLVGSPPPPATLPCL
jgi:hypothetical protein